MSGQTSSLPSLPSLDRFLEDTGLYDLLESIFGVGDDDDCRCEHHLEDERMTVDANACDGNLAAATACRRQVISTCKEQDVTDVLVRTGGLQFKYGDDAVALLAAAGRFLELLGSRDDRMAELAASEPHELARELDTRVDAIGDIGRDSGLIEAAAAIEDFELAMEPTVGLTIAYYFLDQRVPENARLDEVKSIATGSDVRIYDRPDRIPLYQVDVVDTQLSREERELIRRGYELIAEGEARGERAASRAMELAADEPVDPQLTAVLQKHTRGYGIIEDLFSDPEVSDVYVTSPVSDNPLRLKVDGETMATNVHLSIDGAQALASRVRRTSGRAFSRATPTVDATADLECGTGVRIAGVTEPVADGVAFAFRQRVDDRFTLPGLIKNGTMTPEVAGFLSVAVERNAAAMVAGTRGAGKTTLLGTLLYELPADTRTVLIEDTPELPVKSLQTVDRDVQALRTGTGDGPEISPADALRTALRMGDGALIVGEIRGEEARVLYEAMRVGANANAVLGTIHGDGAHDVYERVVSDLDVEPSSFAATDLIVTCQLYRDGEGRKRRISRVEEVIHSDDEVWFESLYEIDEDLARPTGRIDRGESHLVDRLAGPGEEYADVRAQVEKRAAFLQQLAADGRTAPDDVAAAYADRGRTGGLTELHELRYSVPVGGSTPGVDRNDFDWTGPAVPLRRRGEFGTDRCTRVYRIRARARNHRSCGLRGRHSRGLADCPTGSDADPLTRWGHHGRLSLAGVYPHHSLLAKDGGCLCPDAGARRIAESHRPGGVANANPTHHRGGSPLRCNFRVRTIGC